MFWNADTGILVEKGDISPIDLIYPDPGQEKPASDMQSSPDCRSNLSLDTGKAWNSGCPDRRGAPLNRKKERTEWDDQRLPLNLAIWLAIYSTHSAAPTIISARKASIEYTRPYTPEISPFGGVPVDRRSAAPAMSMRIRRSMITIITPMSILILIAGLFPYIACCII
jgi:hypothetical protein